MRIIPFIAMIPLFVAAQELEDLYGIEEAPSAYTPSWHVGISVERIPFDSLTASMQAGYRWTWETENTSVQVFPALSAIQVGSEDPLRLLQASLALSLQWGIFQMGATPWFANAPEEEWNTYGTIGYAGLGGSPWHGSWLESGTYVDWADSSSTTYGLYATLNQRWFHKSIWHGPYLDIDIPLQDDSQMGPRRGRKATFISTNNSLGKLSYQLGYSPEKKIWSVVSQAGIAYSLSRSWDTWGSASVSLSW